MGGIKIMEETLWFGWFYNRESIEENFKVELTNENILVAYYGSDGFYGGGAYVLFEQNGKLYEVFGGHCSCHGLEEQWSPSEVVSFEEFNHRTFASDWDDDNKKINQQIKEYIDKNLKKYFEKGEENVSN